MSLSETCFLVVEDQPFERNMICQMLIGMGARAVHSAEDGKQALRLLRDAAVDVDVILSDVAMPEVDGIEMLAHLKAAREGLLLMFMSGSGPTLDVAVDIAQARGIEVLGTLLKPVSAERIAALFERRSKDDGQHR